ncbi:MAG: MFS transporter, partial [Albidovulum sp.]
RKPAIAGGMLLYVIGAAIAHYANSIEMLLAARVIQGLGAAGPRIVGMALTRDLYEGREMARVMSFVMLVFMIVPAAAPAIGAGIIAFSGWRGVFLAFIVFGLTALTWVSIRQIETLPKDQRRALSAKNLKDSVREVLGDRDVRIYTAVMSLGFGQMFALLSTIQPIFDETYGRAASFPLWFALIAVVSALASVINSRFVMRLGMRYLASIAYLGQAILSVVVLIIISSGVLSGWMAFAAFFLWANSIFFIAGLTFGNLNALALQKMGHIAGMANSIITAIATVGAVLIAGPVGQLFNGTAIPAIMGAALCSTMAYLLLRRTLQS